MQRLGWVVLVALMVMARGAWADPPDARARALALAEDAAVARSRGDLDGAIKAMKEALSLHEEPALIYNLGRLYEDAGVLDLAQHHYTRCLQDAAPDAVKERARKGLERVAEERRVGRLQLTGLPTGSTVSVDGGAPAPLPEGPLRVPAGSRRLAVAAPGFAPVLLVLDVPGGRITTRAVALEPIAAAPAVEAEPADPAVASDAVATDLGPWGWASVGTGIALLAGGGVAVGLGFADWSDVENADGWGTSEVTGLTRADAAARIDAGETKQAVGWALMGVGVAALGAGITLLLLDPDDQPTVNVMPTASSTSVGAAIGGTF